MARNVWGKPIQQFIYSHLGVDLSAGEPGMILPMVDPAAREAEEMMTKPKPSFSIRVTVTSYG